MKIKTLLFLSILVAFISCSSDDDGTISTEDPGISDQCPAPGDLDAVNISTNSARLEWLSASSDFNQVEYGINGYTFGSGTMANSNEPNLTIDGLSPDTAYDFYVRINCGGTEFSEWAGPRAFVTDAD
jgi:hypothetical protein